MYLQKRTLTTVFMSKLSVSLKRKNFSFKNVLIYDISKSLDFRFSYTIYQNDIKTDEDLIEKVSDAFDGEAKIENGKTTKTISIEKFSCIEHAEGKFGLIRDARDLHVNLK